MLGIHEYLWRLIPGNPILRRVVEAAGKRRRDLFVRCGYLGLLVLLVLIALSAGSGGNSLSDMAKTAGTMRSGGSGLTGFGRRQRSNTVIRPK